MIPINTNICTPEDTLSIKEIVDGFADRKDTKVKSYNVKTKQIEDSNVVSTKSSATYELVFIETDYDEVKLIITHDQRVYILNKQEFLRPERIHPGDKLLHIDEIDVNVVKVHKIKNTTSDQVYTLLVENNQNYFANDILIHNND